MEVTLFNTTENFYKGQEEVKIGSFLVPVSSMVQSLYKRPQYYNIIDNDGKL